jgi:hypothetical protein
MAENDRIASIADASKPNAGRIYDYLLGGNHNFEVDRIASQTILKTYPGLDKTARSIRWFLGEAVRRLLADGFTQFIDYASGLPTVDHIHEVAPKGTRVVYSDLDPVTVAYGQEIIKDNPDVRYIVCNVITPEHLFEDTTVAQFINKDLKTAIGMNGIAWFLKDDDMHHALSTLYDWAAKGTRLYISDFNSPSVSNTRQDEASEIYSKKYDQPVHYRTIETLLEICRPWNVQEPGFKPLEEWIGIKAGVSENEMKLSGGYTVGGFLEK